MPEGLYSIGSNVKARLKLILVLDFVKSGFSCSFERSLIPSMVYTLPIKTHNV